MEFGILGRPGTWILRDDCIVNKLGENAQTVVYSHNRILHNKEKEQSAATFKARRNLGDSS